MMRIRKRKRGKHYKTGVHHSDKCTSGPIKYRSGWELTVALYLDNDPTVASYEYETLSIEYISNIRLNKKRHYIPDFLITYFDKPKKLVEVKRKKSVTNILVIKKAKAAREWCKKNDASYEFFTEDIIKIYEKANKIRLKSIL